MHCHHTHFKKMSPNILKRCDHILPKINVIDPLKLIQNNRNSLEGWQVILKLRKHFWSWTVLSAVQDCYCHISFYNLLKFYFLNLKIAVVHFSLRTMYFLLNHDIKELWASVNIFHCVTVQLISLASWSMGHLLFYVYW